MAVEEIDVVELQASEALVEARDEVFARCPRTIGAGPHIVGCLGGDEELVAMRCEIIFEDLAEALLGGTRVGTVVVGEVEMGDAGIEGCTHDVTTLRFGGKATEVVPEAKRDCGEEHAGASAAIIGHDS